MLFIAAITARNYESTNVCAIAFLADNEDEALDEAIAIARDHYPSEYGWADHQAMVEPITREFIIAAYEEVQ